ncbi:AAA family ATPase [Persicitalea sp.]|uniref:ATP-binding protein n=1 Tax=Persicitalea sp. TaxID=3100273 RepID=UPI0035937DE3
MAEYTHKEKLYESETTTINLASAAGRSEDVIIKTPRQGDYSGVYNEYNLWRGDSLRYKTLTVEYIDDKPSLIRTYVPGTSLKTLIAEGNSGPDFFFEYAAEIARQLQDVHDRSIIHKDISSPNIIVNTRMKWVSIVDFDSSIEAESYRVSVFDTTWQIGKTLYISPEQTGRMNRAVDYRTDYYSLGVVFYEMLTGKLPFQSSDVLELINDHLAVEPERVDALVPEIPKVLAELVARLMAKDAEERYQSLGGLIADLQRCRREWGISKKITNFTLGAEDRPARLRVSQKMVGREAELEQILHLFDLAVAGEKVFLTVGGQSGVGKSTLVYETARPLTEHRGLLLSGKFDLQQKNVPYYGWIRALEQFAENVMEEPPEVLEEWREKFSEKLAGLDSILVRLVPKLSAVLDPSTELPEPNATELKNRLQYALGLFISVLASPDHPLVLFLDDWQWADDDSIRLLSSLIDNPNLSHLLLVAAYRTDEVDVTHPFYPLLPTESDENRAESDQHVDIQLRVLTQTDTQTLLRNTLQGNLPEFEQEIDELSSVVFSKTQGNPFFIEQFLNLLFERKLLWMNNQDQTWSWNSDKIRDMTISEDVVNLILDKIQTLEPETLRALSVASAIGNTFSLEQAANVMNQKVSSLHHRLWPAVQSNCILPIRSDYRYIPEFYEEAHTDVNFRFAHDRIQQALYEAIDPEERKSLHLSIGLGLLHAQKSEDLVFEIANHFLKCPDLIRDSESGIAEVLRKAGTKAYQSAAFDAAFQYLSLWESLVPQPDRDLLPQYRMLIETAHLSGRGEASVAIEAKTLDLCVTQEERSETFETMIMSYTATDKLAKATELGRTALAELGIRLPKKARKWQVAYRAVHSRFMLSDTKIATIADWPQMTDSRRQWAMRLLNASLSAYFIHNFDTYPLLIFKMVELNSKFGNTRESITGFGSYGLILAGNMNAPESGYTAGKQALELLEKYQAEELIALAGFIDHTFIAHWKEPIGKMAERCIEAYRRGLAVGDIWYSGWNLYMSNVYCLYVGGKLSHLIESLRAHRGFCVQHNLPNPRPRTDHDLYFCQKMRYANYSDPSFDWQDIISSFQESSDLTALFQAYFHYALCSFWLGETNTAWQMSGLAEKHVESSKSSFSYPFFLIFYSLAGLSVYPHESASIQKKIRAKLSSTLKYLGKIAAMQEANYRWAEMLVQAEYDRVLRQDFKPKNYQSAIEMARQAGLHVPAVLARLQMVRAMLRLEYPDRADELEKLRAELKHWEMEGVLAALDKSIMENIE